MNIYFYGSYEQSVRGFFPAYLSEAGLIAADGSRGFELPQVIFDLFSYDRFRFLWRVYPERDSLFFPGVSCCLLLARELEGYIDGRRAVLNFAVIASADECEKVDDFALAMLSDYSEYEKRIFSMISIGGECGYDIDAPRFFGMMRGCAAKAGNAPKSLSARRGKPFTRRGILKFAALAQDWENASIEFGTGPEWKKQPRRAVTYERFREMFIERRIERKQN